MSITSDLRSYADSALEQGRQVLDQAQAQLTDVTEQANGFVGKLSDTAKDNVSDLTSKASDAVSDLRTQAEKAVNVEAIKAAVEPYLAQAKGYTTSVTDRAEDLLESVKNDPRVAKLIATAESVSGLVVVTVTERVVKPVQSLTGIGVKPVTKPAPTPAAPAASHPTPKAATTKPAPKPAAKATARKAPAKQAGPKS